MAGGAALRRRSRNLGRLPMSSTAMSNPAESSLREIQLPIAPDRRRQDRVVTRLPMRILSVDGNPVFYPAVCTNLSRGGIGFLANERLEVGKDRKRALE